MKLNELIGIKHLNPTDDYTSKWVFSNPSSASEGIRNKIYKWLSKNEYSLMGEGAYADAYSKPNLNYVLKIVGFDKAYSKYIDFIKDNPNIHFPKIFKIINVTDKIKVIKMEKLYKLSDNEFKSFLRIFRAITEQNISANMIINDQSIPQNFKNDLEIIQQNESLLHAIELVNNKFKYYIDMHKGNVMKRQNNTFVLIDPVS